MFDVGTLTYKYIFFLVEVQLWVWLKIGHCFNFDKFNVLVVHVVIYYIGIITRYFEMFIYQLLFIIIILVIVFEMVVIIKIAIISIYLLLYSCNVVILSLLITLNS